MKRYFVPIIVVVFVFLLSFFFFRKAVNDRGLKEGEIKEEQAALQEGEIKEVSGLSIEEVVLAFLQNWQKAAVEKDEAAAERAFAFLSQEAQGKVKNFGLSLADSLTRFVGVQNFPEGGFTLGKVVTQKGAATVEVELRFLAGVAKRTFSLVAEDDEWRIDQVF